MLVLRTLALSFAGGGVFFLLGLPAPWLTGGVLAVATAEMCGVAGRLPKPMQDVALVLLGASLGASMSPESLSHIFDWPLSLAGLVVSMILVQVAAQEFLVRVCGWSRRTAFFAAVPGVLSFVIATAGATGADNRLVTVAQFFRLLALVLILPSGMVLFGIHSVPSTSPSVPLEALPMLLLAGAAIAGRFAFVALRLPLPGLFGALAASTALYGSGAISGTLPPLLMVAAIVILAASIGERFGGLDIAGLRSALLASAGAFAVSLLASISVASCVSLLLPVPLASLIVAYAPGGLDTMLVLALSLHLDTAFVAVHHLARFIGISFVLPFVATRYRVRGTDASDG